MEIRLNYTPLEWQYKVHVSHVQNVCLVGGLGCIRESSLVETARGRIPIGDTTPATEYVSLDLKTGQYLLQRGTAGFPKGKANLYRVVHDQGEFVAAGFHLVLDGSCTYSRVDGLSVGDQLLIAKQDRFRSIVGQAPKESLEDAHGWTQTVLDSLDHYATCIRQYGQRLLDPEVFSRLFSPLQAYALEFSHSGVFQTPLLPGARVLDTEQEHNQIARRLFLQSKLDYILQMERVLGVALDGDSSTKPSEHISLGTLQSHLSPKTFLSRQTEQRFSQRHTLVASSFGQNTSKSTILSIEKLPSEEWYWDLQVPNTNNYIVDGTVHHNSGKSVCALRELQAQALRNPGGLYLIGRKTLPSLRDTTYRSFFQQTEESMIKSHNKANMTVKLVNNAEFIFRPLDDMEKFKSLEISGFFLDEANEIEEAMYNTLIGRVRQKVNGRTPFYRTIIAHNPGDDQEWIPQRFLYRKPPNHEIHFSSTFDNIKNLAEGYVESLQGMYSEDALERMLYGRYGKVFHGRPVFPQFAKNMHKHVRTVQLIPEAPIFRGIDFGYNKPACTWLQFHQGQIRILHAIKGKEIYLEDFVRDHILATENELWPGWKAGFKCFCDPAGSQESDKGKSSVEILNDFGIQPQYRRTKIEEGLKAIKYFMDTETGGVPNLIIDPRAVVLIDAWKGGYRWDNKGEKPDKTSGYDDVSDSARYPIVGLYRRMRFGDAEKVFANIPRIYSPMGRPIEF